MAKTKSGTITTWQQATPLLSVFRLMPENGSQFPTYKAGQYIALRRDDCMLTKKIVGAHGEAEYVPNLDADGKQKIGPVTHSYSIASPPFETTQHGYLEFYVILEKDEKGMSGRLTESLFRMSPQGDNHLTYYEVITGTFTLDKRANDCHKVVFVGTGTGLAPFVAIVKQLDFEARNGNRSENKYTLIHANRTFEELDYYDELCALEKAQNIDFMYVPSVSRDVSVERLNPAIGKGRANNLLRHIFEMPLKEEQDLQEALAKGEDTSRAQKNLDKTTRPALPQNISREQLRARMDAPKSVIITCGNPWSMADIKFVADANQIRFEKEDW